MISIMALYMCQVLHIVDFLGSRRMETAPTSIEVLLRPAQSQSDEPSIWTKRYANPDNVKHISHSFFLSEEQVLKN